MVGEQPTASPQQMRETRLMQGLCEASIRCPSVADHHAGKVFAEQRGGLGIAPTGLNGIHGGVGRRDCPEPLELPRHLPARFIGRHDGTAPDLLSQRRVDRLSLAGRAMDGMDQAAPADRQPTLLAKERRDFAERQAPI